MHVGSTEVQCPGCGNSSVAAHVGSTAVYTHVQQGTCTSGAPIRLAIRRLRLCSALRGCGRLSVVRIGAAAWRASHGPQGSRTSCKPSPAAQPGRHSRSTKLLAHASAGAQQSALPKAPRSNAVLCPYASVAIVGAWSGLPGSTCLYRQPLLADFRLYHQQRTLHTANTLCTDLSPCPRPDAQPTAAIQLGSGPRAGPKAGI